jgi:hypothetical protein
MNNDTNKQAFLIITQNILKPTINLYLKIKEATKNLGDVFLIYHSGDNEIPKEYENLEIQTFSDAILTDLNYTPISKSIFPGSNHFPILNFYLKNKNYTHYWCIENDVAFNGTWDDFFNNIPSKLDYDFITSHIRKYDEVPHWHWWKTFSANGSHFSKEELYRSFNPIYRISGTALKYIDSCLKSGCKGHHEVLYPSLLKKAGFNFADLSSEENYLTTGLSYCTLETMRWKPVFLFKGFKKNKLYHPVKPQVTFRQLMVYIKRSLLNEKRYLT